MPHLFTYGTLMYSQVWQKLVSQDYQSEPAALPGFARYRVKGEVYPAITTR